MNRIASPVIVAVACAAFLAAPATAQHLLELPGKTVEVIGLRRWTIPMLQDSLAKYAPGERLDSHGCAAALRYKIGFPDAAVIHYGKWPGDSLERVVVMLVEPADSGRVHHRPAPVDSASPRAEWREGIQLLRSAPGAVQVAVRHYSTWKRDPQAVQIPVWARRDSLQIREYWEFLRARDSEADYQLALEALGSDADHRNRAVAATILATFSDRDEAIYRLFETLRETDGNVRMMAANVLGAIAHEGRRAIDWNPVAPTVHAILNGTGLFTLPTVLRVLVLMGTDSQYARPFLAEGGEALLDNLAAKHPEHRTPAHTLLVQLRGADLGTEVAVWRAWVHSL